MIGSLGLTEDQISSIIPGLQDQTQDNVYITEVKKEDDLSPMRNERLKLLEQYQTGLEANPEKLMEGIDSLDTLFVSFFNLETVLQKYMEKRGGVEPEQLDRVKLNLLSDIIAGAINIEDLVEPATIKKLEKNFLYRSTIV